MRTFRAIAIILWLFGTGVSAQGTQAAPPPQTAPADPSSQPVAGAPTTPTGTPLVARSFLAPAGMIFNAVRPERVADFELVMGYLQAALAQSANQQVRAQAKGWRMFKATEPGPNGTVLYVFMLDPTVTGADYALGPILSDAFPGQVEQIWKLYQGSLAGGGSLLNLTPVEPPPLPAPGAPVPAPGATAAPDGTTQATPGAPPATPAVPAK